MLSANVTDQTKASDEPSLKRRKVRKGTLSFWECKHCKRRCEFGLVSNSACVYSQGRGLPCISPEIPESTINPTEDLGTVLSMSKKWCISSSSSGGTQLKYSGNKAYQVFRILILQDAHPYGQLAKSDSLEVHSSPDISIQSCLLPMSPWLFSPAASNTMLHFRYCSPRISTAILFRGKTHRYPISHPLPILLLSLTG
jgi:hypothetical protein